MKTIGALAANTFREAVRDRVLYSLLFFAVLVLMASLAVENITIGDQEKVVRSFAYGAIRLFGAMIALFLGVSLVYKELERKTIYTIVSKPIPRWLFLFGKYLGLMAVLVLEILAMAALYAILMSLTQGAPGAPFYTALLMLVVELSLLVAWAILFSSYSAPTTATLFSLAVFFIGNLADDILRFGQNSESALIIEGSQWLYWILPNFELLNGSHAAVHQQSLSTGHVVGSLAYGMGYTLAVLAAAVLVFSRRDFK